MNHGFLLILLLLIFNCPRVFAADSDTVGRIKTVSKPTYVLRGVEKITAKPNMKIIRNDTLLTGKQGSVGIVFNDNSTLSLGPDSIFKLVHYEFNVLDKKTGFIGRIRRGSMIYLSGLIAKMNIDVVRFETPTAVAGVRGTKLAIKVEGDDNE
jgi:hypothetical protein